MTRVAAFLVALCLSLPVWAQDAKTAAVPTAKGFTFNLNGVPLQQVVALVYGQILNEPFMLDDIIKASQVTISFQKANAEAVREVLDAYLSSKGIARVVRGGVNLFVPKGKEPEATFARESPASGSAILAQPLPSPGRSADMGGLVDRLQDAKPAETQTAFLYQSRFRPVGDLVKVVASLLGGGNSAQAAGDDAVVLIGPQPRVALARAILDQFDRPTSEVLVKATVVEYTSTDDDGAGFFAALKTLGGKLSVAVGDKSAFANLVSFKDATIEAVLSVISQDSRFSVLDSSSLRVVSGKSGRLVVGQEVPVLSQFQLDAKGNPVQSVQYRSSGVILDVKPLVVSDKVHAELLQEVSSFAVTRTSNIDSPTLLKRQFSTNLTADFGEVVFLGGLDEDRNTEAQSGLFGWRLSRNESKSKTTLFLVLQFAKA